MLSTQYFIHNKDGREVWTLPFYMQVGRWGGEGNGNPLQYSCLENPMDGGAWWAAVHEVAKSQTRLSDFTFTFHFHTLEKETATHSSVLAWRIPGTGEPGGLLSMGLHRVRHNWSDLAAAAGRWGLKERFQEVNRWSGRGLLASVLTSTRQDLDWDLRQITHLPVASIVKEGRIIKVPSSSHCCKN